MGGADIERAKGRGGKSGGSILGSLRDALAAASRDDVRRTDIISDVPATAEMKDVTNALPPVEAGVLPVANDAGAIGGAPTELAEVGRPPVVPTQMSRPDIALEPGQSTRAMAPAVPGTLHVAATEKRAADAAREARGGTPNVPDLHLEDGATPPTTNVVRKSATPPKSDDRPGSGRGHAAGQASAATRFVRGKQKVARTEFSDSPVVGWLVIVGGPGLGSYRAVYEGNNTIGRADTNRIAIDFGDESISKEEQAYIRYDNEDRSFLLVPNLTKTNVIAHNETRPAQPVPLSAMDLITMGRTQLVFVPFCGPDFDWGELSELNR